MRTDSQKNSTSDKISYVLNPRQPHSKHTKKILALFDDGYTYGEIAARLSLNPLHVFDIIHSHLRRMVGV